MIIEYCHKAIGKAEYRKLEDGTWFAEIPGFKGVWANGDSVEECRKELLDVLEEWLFLKLRDKDPIPTVDGLKIEIRTAIGNLKRKMGSKIASKMKTITVLEKENADLDRLYWLKKSPEERLSAVEFLREQFYSIQGFTSIPRLTKSINIAEGFD